MNRRSIPLAIIFTILTLGIYSLYWFYKQTNEVHAALGRQTSASGGMAVLYSFITFGLYFFYWVYKISDSLVEAKENRAMRASNNIGIICLLLSVCGFGIVSLCIIQSGLNDIADFEASHAVPAITKSDTSSL